MNWAEPHPIEVAGLLRELAVKLLDARDLDQALDDVAATVHATLGVPCGISVWGVNHPACPAARPAAFVVLSETELLAGDGPGLTAIQHRDVVACGDLAVEQRWPDWRRQALRHGLRSVLIIPLDVDGDTVASLSLYATEPHGIDAATETIARVLAEHIGLLLRHLMRRRREEGPSDLPVLHRASGVIMAQWGCAEDEARAILTATSAALAIPLTELATRLVTAVQR
jgi:GAF domain-containing protein